MKKTYADYMNEISPDELYKGLLAHGLFSEKLPPIFTSEPFYKYCVSGRAVQFSRGWREYVTCDVMRNINIPRSLGIPNPIAYQKLCEVLRDNWPDIQGHFQQHTSGQKYKTSRIHIRKRASKESLFEMNYSNWMCDGTPELDLLLGSRYVVKADISTCFPSIYTHSIPWALVGKDAAKANKNGGWQNDIDKCCQNMRNGETHGLMIGPHTSNLVSEIILTVIDKRLLDKDWRFIRHIDDYDCYVPTYEKAQKFLLDLNSELKHFDLPLNHKKTKIIELPAGLTSDWVRQLGTVPLATSGGKVNYKTAQAFMDLAVNLMYTNGMDAAVLKYALKMLSKQPLTDNAKQLCSKEATHLAIIYPYLIPLLKEYVFEPYGTSTAEISEFSNLAYVEAKEADNFEAACYAIFFSLTYNFKLDKICPDDMLTKNDCLYKLFGQLYYKKYGNVTEQRKFRDHAKQLKVQEMDRNWLFIYETLTEGNLSSEWKELKKEKISFIVPQYQ